MKMSKNQPLAGYTSLKAGGNAHTLITLEAGDNLVEVIKMLKKDEPLWVLGFGTNCLISDEGLPGTVVLNRHGKIQQISETTFKVGSGVDWDDFIRALLEKNLWGLEFTSGIPGGVGAGITGNIAAYGHKVADCFVEATVLDAQNGHIAVWPLDMLEFVYRGSALQKPENSHLVVVDATFKLSNEPTSELEYESALKIAKEIGVKPDTLENRRKIIMETRRRAGSLLNDPASGPWTAGSFFKNPEVSEEQIDSLLKFEEAGLSRDELIRQSGIHTGSKARVSAAHVLLAAGFKRGQSFGNVRLHPEHILKIENTGSASAQEIYNAVQHVLETVNTKLGIQLEPEVRFLGQFLTS